MLEKNLILGSLVLLAILSGCATRGARGPSSDERDSLSEIIDQIGKNSKTHGSNSQACKDNYDEIAKRLFHLAGDISNLDLNDIAKMDQDIKDSFSARLALKESFKSFNTHDDCYKSASDVFRGLRYVEDYLIELRMDRTQSGPSEYIDLKGEFPFLLVNPKYANDFKSYEDLKSGDVLLSRGNAFSAAAISRASMNDYQLANLSFIYKESEKSELMTTEAHMEIGSVVEPIDTHIAAKNTREVVLRYNNAEVAHKASKYMYDKVLSADKNGHNIEYDFSMNSKDETKLFSSEVVSRGFKHVSPEEDYFPVFKSPGDLQFDPRFEIVAEWRNPRKMEESRLKDFILTKMFELIDQKGYVIDSSSKMANEAKNFWLLRRTPVVRKFMDTKSSKNMSSAQMELFMAIDKIGDAVYKEIEKKSLEFERPMTPKEIDVVLDDFFKQDFETYTRYKSGQDVAKPVFHLWFHP